MKGVQCNELFGGIALKNHAFFMLHRQMVERSNDYIIYIHAYIYYIIYTLYIELCKPLSKLDLPTLRKSSIKNERNDPVVTGSSEKKLSYNCNNKIS